MMFENKGSFLTSFSFLQFKSHDDLVDFLTLLIAAACIGAMCSAIPWVVALRTASNFGIAERKKVAVPVSSPKKTGADNKRVLGSDNEEDHEATLELRDKLVFTTVLNPNTNKPYTHGEIVALGRRNSKRVMLGMAFMVPLSAIVSIICCLVFYDWATLKFAASVCFVLNGATSSWVATNHYRR